MENSIDELTKLRAEGYSLIMANAELSAQYQVELNELNARYKPQFDANQQRLTEIQQQEVKLNERSDQNQLESSN